MSRSSRQDNSTSVTLFPFLAVLLCTMGSLLLILVVVAKVSRDRAVARADAERQATVAALDDEAQTEARRQLAEAEAQATALEKARALAEAQLRQEQLRLRHIEDHMRRLEDQLVSLQLAAGELQAMEEEHFDDRQQAEREVARLQRLIDETREQIEELKQEQAGPKAYAIVPYKGPNGTTRRPIYVECTGDVVVLQPEGIRFMQRDFTPLLGPNEKLGPGNPLASALRAVRDQMIRDNPEFGVSADAEPYPLLIVRPDSPRAYNAARAALESWDTDFGYEFIGQDWRLALPDANPQLAVVAQNAIERARARQRMLAQAAPGRIDWFEPDEVTGNLHIPTSGKSIQASSSPASLDANQQETTIAGRMPDGNILGGSGNSQQMRGLEDNEAMASATSGGGSAEPGNADMPDGENGLPDGAFHAQTSSAAMSQGSEPGGQSMGATGGVVGQSGTAVQNIQANLTAAPYAETNGPSRASDGNDVPIRRVVQVVVREDRVAILPEGELASAEDLGRGGKTIRLTGRTQAAVGEFLGALKRHVDGWGFSGQGMYWIPVVTLHVAPGGGRRAHELARALTRGGIEVRNAQTAKISKESTDETATH